MPAPFFTQLQCLRCGRKWWSDHDQKKQEPCSTCRPIRFTDADGKAWTKYPVAIELGAMAQVETRSRVRMV